MDPARDVRLAWGGLVASGGVAGFAAWAAASGGSFVAAGAGLHLAVGAGVWLGVLLTAQRELRAREEALERQRLAALTQEGRRALFEDERADDEAARRLGRFRGAGHTLIALVLAVLSAGGALWLGSRFPRETVQPSLPVAAVLATAAFALLLLGRYAFALASERAPLPAAGGRRALSGALVCFLASLATVAHVKGLHQADLLGWAFLAVELLLALEALLLVVLEAYRPRRAGEVARPPFDSRLLGLLSSPTDVARSIARAVDYQFGFSISQTWFYRFLARWVAPLALFALVSFWALSALVVVEPHEQVVVRRLGRLLPEPLQPGLHLVLPWPLDEATRVPAGRQLTVDTEGREEDDEHEGEGAILWTVRPWKLEDAAKAEAEHLLLIARDSAGGGSDETPVNLLSAAATVHYRVDQALGYAERAQDPAAVLRALTERELCFLFGGEDLDRLLRERPRHAADLAARLQRAAATLSLGVSVESALFTDLHPPVSVGEAFEEPTAALERAEAEVLEARVERTQLDERSRSEAAWVVEEARLEAAERLALAQAEAARFAALRALDRAAPRLFRLTRLLEELAEGARGKRKLVLGDRRAVTELDLQEKVSAEDLGLGGELTGPSKPAGGKE
ncbi:MAG: SPFH domain-containing protein [Planctomycetota bacterium]